MTLTLKQARLLADLTQQEVADQLGVHIQTYMKWERDPEEMKVKTAKRAANIMKRNYDEIFFVGESNLIRQPASNKKGAS